MTRSTLLRRWTAAGAVAALAAMSAALPGYPAAPNLVPLVSRVTPSVIYVLSKDEKGQPFESGTAFAVGPRGFLLTALHVVQDAAQIAVTLPDRETFGADVVGVDTDHDVAVLHVPSMPAPGPPPLALGDSAAVRLGQGVVVVGYPLASPQSPTVTVTQGIVSGLRSDAGYLQVDAAMNPGVSGGPVLTDDGLVVGIADATLRGAQNFNFAVPVNFARALLDRAESGGPLPPPVPLPLTRPVQVPLAYSSGGIGPRGRQARQGVSCAAPPPRAAELDTVQVELTSEVSLHVITWLSWGKGAPANSDLSFGRVDASAHHSFQGVLPRLHLQPGTVCLNYTVSNTSVLPIGQTFQVRYTLGYRVFPAPASPATP